jgi:Arc/MetJ family transcription regulator
MSRTMVDLDDEALSLASEELGTTDQPMRRLFDPGCA